MALSDAQTWALRAIHENGGVIAASRLGVKMLDRPALDTTGKRYSPYTLGRMGGGMIMHLKKSGMVRSKKIRGLTVAILTKQGKRYFQTPDETLPHDLAQFMEDHL